MLFCCFIYEANLIVNTNSRTNCQFNICWFCDRVPVEDRSQTGPLFPVASVILLQFTNGGR